MNIIIKKMKDIMITIKIKIKMTEKMIRTEKMIKSGKLIITRTAMRGQQQ